MKLTIEITESMTEELAESLVNLALVVAAINRQTERLATGAVGTREPAGEAEEAPKRVRRTKAQIAADEAAAKEAPAASMVVQEVEVMVEAPVANGSVTADMLRALGAEIMAAKGSPRLVEVLFDATGQRSIRALTSAEQHDAAYAAFKAELVQ